MCLTETEREGVNLIHLSENRDQWRAVVNKVMNHRVPYKGKENFVSR